ncbi:MAG: hypothetical protein WKF96_24010 [Solirubrobacteraceae bacterium]
MNDPGAAVGGFIIYVAIGVLLLATGSTAGGIVWLVMAAIGGLAIIATRD